MNESRSGQSALLVVVLVALAGLLIAISMTARGDREAVAALEQQVQSQSEETQATKERVEALITQKSQDRLDAKLNLSHVEKLTTELRALSSKVRSISDQLAATRKERDEHLAARIDLTRRLADTESAWAGEEARSRESEAALEKRVEDLDARIGDLKKVAQDLAGEKARADARVQELAANAAALGRRLDVAAARQDATARQLTSMKRDLEASLERAMDLKARADAAEKGRAEAVAAREEMARRLKEALAKLKDQVEEK